jgi:hypothetical protein
MVHGGWTIVVVRDGCFSTLIRYLMILYLEPTTYVVAAFRRVVFLT